MNNSKVLECNEISFSYGSYPVLENISLELNKGEIASILGPSGCGKTTLLRIIAGLETSQKGSVAINGEVVQNQKLNCQPHQRKIGYIFQDYALFPNLSVEQNILFGVGNKKDSSSQMELTHYLEVFGLKLVAKKYPHQLSGGQQQRVAIARALATKPKILLMDEPFSNLDVHLREHIVCELNAIIKKLEITVLNVTHDITEALTFSDKIGVMMQGKLVQWGAPADVYQFPHSLMVSEFLQSGQIFECQWREGRCLSPFGAIEIKGYNSKSIQNSSVKVLYPHGAINWCEAGPFVGKVSRIFYRGKSKQVYLQYQEVEFYLIVSPFHEFHIGQSVSFEVKQQAISLLH